MEDSEHTPTPIAMVPDFFTGQVVNVNLEEKTGLKINGRCKRSSANLSMSNFWEDGETSGTVKDLFYEGQDMLGGYVYTARVLWDNGKEYKCGTGFLESQAATALAAAKAEAL